MNKLNIATASVVALFVAGLGLSAVAYSSDKAATVAAQESAAITMIQAISIAEEATGGKTAEAEFESEDGIALYEIEVNMADGSEVELEIDADSGVILKQEIED